MQQLLKPAQARLLRGHRRRRRALSPGPLGTGMVEDFVDCKHGRKADRASCTRWSTRCSRRPTASSSTRSRSCRSRSASPATRSAAPISCAARWARRSPRRWRSRRQTFVDGAREERRRRGEGDRIFQELEGFAAYGFNKSHSAAYALITYQTAYLKAHYPVEFLAALLTADKDKIEKVVRTIAEARAWGVTVLPPDVNESETDFTVVYAHPNGRRPGARHRQAARPLRAADPLRARRGARRRRGGARDDARGAARERRRSAISSTSRRASTRSA